MSATPKQDVVISRIINAPVAILWDAWTKPEHVQRWWGPQDFTSPSCKIDLREGGSYLFAMRASEYMGGADSYTAGEYKEIVPQKKLVFTQRLADAEGKDLPASQLPPDFPGEVLTTITFTEINGMTQLLITETGWKPSQMAAFAYAGMHQSLDKLAATV